MSTRLILGIAGAVIGGAIGSAIPGLGTAWGAQLGFLAGSYIGGSLEKKPEGPKLQDLKVTASTYGQPLGLVFNAMRTNGNIFWSEDLRAHASSSEGEGDGFLFWKDDDSNTTTTYTYTCSFAVGLCEGPMAALRRVWLDGTLVHDTTGEDHISYIDRSLIFYPGTEDQEPDPRMQADLGADVTPAYRGLCYLMFADLPLANYGNRIPNVSAEVASYGVGGTTDAPNNPFVVRYDPSGHYMYASIWPGTGFMQFDAITGVYIQSFTGFAGTTSQGTCYAVSPTDGAIWATSGNSTSPAATDGRMQRRGPVGGLSTNVALGSPAAYPHLLFDNAGNIWMQIRTGTNTVDFRRFNVSSGAVDVSVAGIPSGGGTMPGSWTYDRDANAIWFLSPGGSTKVTKFDCASHTFPLAYTASYQDNVASNAPISILYDPFRVMLWMYNGSTHLMAMRTSDGVLVHNIDVRPAIGGGSFAFYSIAVGGGFVWVVDNGHGKLLKVNPEAGTVELILADADPWGSSIAYDAATNEVWWGGSITVGPPGKVLRISPLGPWSLADIVTDISERVQLTASDLDVEEIRDIFPPGFWAQEQMTARAALEQLLGFYAVDVSEVDGKLKYVKRGHKPVLTIPTDDLAAHESGSEVPPILELTRGEETVLPKQVEVQYYNPDFGYQTGMQRAQKIVTQSLTVVTATTAIAETDNRAKQAAEMMMYEAWNSRTAYVFQLPVKYLALAPTDVVTVTDSADIHTIRLIKTEWAKGILRCEGVLQDELAYFPGGAGQQVPIVNRPVITPPSPTDIAVLNAPALREQDNNNGEYIAVAGEKPSWPGALVFRNSASIFTQSQQAMTGSVSAALGNFFGGDTFDELNTVTVTLLNSDMALSSVSTLEVLAGKNTAWLGNAATGSGEIFSFRDATQNVDGTYTLRGLLRGRQGSEWYQGLHSASDIFVTLNNTRFWQERTATLGSVIDWAGVTVGQGFTLGTSNHRLITNNAEPLRPYAPVLLGGGRNAAGDIILNWVRRTRLVTAWMDGVDVPLNEASESYDVDIYDASGYATVKRTYSVLPSPTVTYTAAQQTSDFGSLRNPVYWIVAQRSELIGRGHEARGVT